MPTGAGSPEPKHHVAAPPAERPLLVFDGDCGFCRYWIARWRAATADRVDYAPYQEVAGRFPEVPVEDFRRSVQLIDTGGAVTGGAEAVFRALAHAPGRRWPLWLYLHVPPISWISETVYRFVAGHRPFFSKLTLRLWGRQKGIPAYHASRRIFLIAVGLIYMIAFLSLGAQIAGLAGESGILPAQSYLAAAASQLGAERYHLLPTLCWLGAGDAALKGLCWAGVAVSGLLLLGIAPPLCLFVLWAIYLSLSVVCRTFLNFQWDILLLETGFLAIFLAPMQLRLDAARARPPSRAALFLARWLLFRLMFGSGLVKLSSGDATWRSLTALTLHYETQPLPVWTSWYMHQLPAWFHKASCAFMFGIELAVPFLFFMPRRLKIAAFWLTLGLQIGFGATGNYTFFNLLSIALCLALLDDAAWPARIKTWLRIPEGGSAGARRRVPSWITIPVAAAAVLISGTAMMERGRLLDGGARPLAAVQEWIAPFRSLNAYGLFAVMTTSRPEIIVEGSDDRTTWVPYEFKWKPGDLTRRPRFVEPHQPRLDWQMWFAALSSYPRTPWFSEFLKCLLTGSPPVLALLERNPFPDKPPRYVRAVVYDYYFTDFAERGKDGAWWRREYKGAYSPVVSLQR